MPLARRMVSPCIPRESARLFCASTIMDVVALDGEPTIRMPSGRSRSETTADPQNRVRPQMERGIGT